MTYKILVKDADGNNLGEFDRFKNLKFGKRLNNYGACTFDIPIIDEKAASLVALRQYTVWIYRDDDLVWAGEQAIREGKLDDKGDNWATIHCFDWFEQLNSKYTAASVTYTAEDAGQIAVDLIDGAFAITEGTIEPTQNRDRTYVNKNVMDEIINLANVINGFDFEINNFKLFNVYSSIGIDRSNEIILEYGFNVTSMRITEDFANPVTKAIVLGDSGNPLDALRVERNDAGLQTLYGVREELINEMSVIETATLQAKGDALIRKYGTPLMKVTLGIVRSVTPTIIDFSLGDVIRLKVDRGIYDIDENYRIFEWGLSVAADNTETLDLVLGNFNQSEIS